MSKEGSEIERHADFVALLVKAPRVASELAALIGVQPNTVRAWLFAFEAEGLVRRSQEKRLMKNIASTVWEWCA